MNRKLVTVSLVALFVGVLAACSSDGDSKKPTPAPEVAAIVEQGLAASRETCGGNCTQQEFCYKTGCCCQWIGSDPYCHC